MSTDTATPTREDLVRRYLAKGMRPQQAAIAASIALGTYHGDARLGDEPTQPER